MTSPETLPEEELNFLSIVETERLAALYYEIGRTCPKVLEFISSYRSNCSDDVEKIQSRAAGVIEIIEDNFDQILRDGTAHSTLEKALRTLTACIDKSGLRLNPKLIGALLLVDEYPETPWTQITCDQQKQQFMFYFYEGRTERYPFAYNRAVQLLEPIGRTKESVKKWEDISEGEFRSKFEFFEFIVDWSYPLSEIKKSFNEHIDALLPEENRKHEEAIKEHKAPRGSGSYWGNLNLPYSVNDCLFLLSVFRASLHVWNKETLEEAYPNVEYPEYFKFADQGRITKADVPYEDLEKVYDLSFKCSFNAKKDGKYAWEAFKRHIPIKIRLINQLCLTAFDLPDCFKKAEESLEVSRNAILR